MRNERIVVPRQRLLEEVWGYDPFATTNTIEVFVSNLRRKLEAGGEARLLHTIRGAGYVLRASALDHDLDPLAAGVVSAGADVRDPRRRSRSSSASSRPRACARTSTTRSRPPSTTSRDRFSFHVATTAPPRPRRPRPRPLRGARPARSIRVLQRDGRLLDQTKRAPNFGILLGRTAETGGYRVETRVRNVPVRHAQRPFVVPSSSSTAARSRSSRRPSSASGCSSPAASSAARCSRSSAG